MELPPSPYAVESIFEQHTSILASLPLTAVSDRVALDDTYRKILVLASASYLESLMFFRLNEYFVTLGDRPHTFIRRFGLDRKFFQWFDFDKSTPDYFFGLFGPDCKALYKTVFESTDTFQRACESFMTLCATRNQLVHNNLAEVSFSLTVEEINTHFRAAMQFPDLAIRVVDGRGSGN